MTTQGELGAVSPADNLMSGSGSTLDKSKTYAYVKICNDKKSGAGKDVTFYRPVPPAGYFIVGDYAQTGSYDNAPVGCSVVVKPIGEDPNNPLLKPPLTYEQTWSSDGKTPKQPFSIWRPVPPDNYVAVGYVATTGFEKPHIENYRCLRKDVVGDIHRGPAFWTDEHTHASRDVTLYSINEYENAFIAGIWESYELYFSMKGLRDFSFDVEGYSVGSQKWGGVTCETEVTGATMFVRAEKHGTEETAEWFKKAVDPGAAIADMTSSDWPNKLDVAFKGKMSFTHLENRYEGLDIVLGQGYKGFPTLTHNWWIGGPHMSPAIDVLKAVSALYQTFGLKTKLGTMPTAKVTFMADALHTCVFKMSILALNVG